MLAKAAGERLPGRPAAVGIDFSELKAIRAALKKPCPVTRAQVREAKSDILSATLRRIREVTHDSDTEDSVSEEGDRDFEA